MKQPLAVKLSEVVGGAYGSFWRTRCRYRVVKGSRASKKSKTIALWYIVHLLAYPLANLLVVRRWGYTLRDSCFTDLCWAMRRLGVEDQFIVHRNALLIENRFTGQRVLFRGLDDAQKITSITVNHGVLCWCWVEEAYEISKEAEFNKLEMSIRGKVPPGYFKQITLSFNPWNAGTWLKRRFFDTPSPDVFTLTTTYRQNEWLDESDRRIFEDMRINAPARYRVEGLGEWGISGGLIYERVDIAPFDADTLRAQHLRAWYGLDFGFTDPTAFVGGFIDKEKKELWVCWEVYVRGKTNQEVAQIIKDKIGIKSEIVYCDSAEPKSIEELRRAGINARGADKGGDSVRFGIQALQNFLIHVQPAACPNVVHEITAYAWEKDRAGNNTDRPEHDYSHSMDAMRYGVVPLLTRSTPWNSRKMFT